MNNRSGPVRPRRDDAQSQSQLQPQPRPAPPPSPSPSTHRDRPSDARSLLAPSFSSTVPSRSLVPTAGPSPTQGISASPSSLSIARSPTGGQYDPKGGAAARLRRVASNASIQAAQPQQARPQSQARDIAPLTSPSGTAMTPSADAALSIAPPPAASASASADPPAPPPPPSEATGATKRPGTPSQLLRPEQAEKRQARRKTWFGWTTSDGGGEEEQQQQQTQGKRDEQHTRAETVEQTTQAAATAQQTSQSRAEAGNAAPAPSPAPPAPPTTDETPATPAPSAAPSVLDVQAAQQRDRRTSWFGWRTPPVVPTPAKAEEARGAQDGDAAAHTGTDAQQEPPSSDTVMRIVQDATQVDTKPLPNGEGNGKPADGATAAASNTPRYWSFWSANNKSSNTHPTSKPEEPATIAEAHATPSLPQPISTPKAEPEPEQTEAKSSLPPPSQPAPSSWSSWIPYWGYMTTTATRPEEDADAKSQSGEAQTAPHLTPAEQVKAAALARPDPSPPAGHAPSITPSDAILNPVTKASWISYFSSRSARPAGRVEAAEPEVMVIDFSEDEAQAQTKAPAPAPATTKGKAQNGSMPQLAAKRSLLAAPRPGSSASSSRDAPRPQPDPAPPVSRPTTPLTGDKTKAQEVVKKSSAKDPKKPSSLRPPVPNLVLPTFEDTFDRPPRSLPPPAGVLKRTLNAMNAWLSSQPADPVRLRTAPRVHSSDAHAHPDGDSIGLALAEKAALRLPRSWATMAHRQRAEKRGCAGVKRICIVALHGWFAQSWASKFMGEPTGTSIKFATGMRDAVLRHFKAVDGMELNPEAITMIPLSADGTVQDRVDRSFAALLSRREWVEHLQSADAIFFACHSQGCIVGTHLLARLVEQSYIQPRRTRIALLAMCGIHSGPFEHLRSTVVASYVNYFETAAARELFDFHQPDSAVSRRYHASLRVALDAGVKYVLVASTDDQVVPLHSALFSSAQHPSILRALYVHGATFPKLDFLTNMLTFCVAVRNAGLSDHDLLALLSTSVAGSLYGGLGHSLCYDEPKTYDLAVRYLLETTHPLSEPTTRAPESGGSAHAHAHGHHPPRLELHSPSSPRTLANPHLLPWSLRGLLEDRAVRATLAGDIAKLLRDFEMWRPATKTLKDVQYRLEPMRGVARPSAGVGVGAEEREEEVKEGEGKEGGGGAGAEKEKGKGQGKVATTTKNAARKSTASTSKL